MHTALSLMSDALEILDGIGLFQAAAVLSLAIEQAGGVAPSLPTSPPDAF